MHTDSMRHEHSSKASKAADTRQRLINTARSLFAERGYSAVSLEDVLAGVQLTKGALYHHFRDKKDLFREVLNTVQQQVAAKAQVAGGEMPEPAEGLKAVCQALLHELQKPDVMRIVCLDAGAVLTWAECAEIDERHMFAVLRTFIGAARFSIRENTTELEATVRALAGAIYQTVEWASRENANERISHGERVILRLVEAIARN